MKKLALIALLFAGCENNTNLWTADLQEIPVTEISRVIVVPIPDSGVTCYVARAPETIGIDCLERK